MIRSFLAIPIPEDVADALLDLQSGVRNARWVEADNLHLTLVFLGEQGGETLRELDGLLADVAGAPFALEIAGAGAFGGGRPHTLYAGLTESAALRRLQAKTARAAEAAGVALERRKFTPHVTLGRCGRAVAPEQALDWAAKGARFRAGPFLAESFSLFRSDLGSGPPVYTEMARYPLLRDPAQ